MNKFKVGDWIYYTITTKKIHKIKEINEYNYVYDVFELDLQMYYENNYYPKKDYESGNCYKIETEIVNIFGILYG